MKRALISAAGLLLMLAAPAAAREADWQILPAPGMEGECMARLLGAGANLNVMATREGGMVMSVGHPSWSLKQPDSSMTLMFDGGEPITVGALALGPIVAFGPNADMQQRLRAASSLDVTVPPGRFHFELGDPAQAIDDALACRNISSH